MSKKPIVILQIIFLFVISSSSLAQDAKTNADVIQVNQNTKNNTVLPSHGDYFRQFQEVFNRIEKEYVQESNKQEMVDEAINGMLKSLDPYSGYYTDDDLEFFLTNTDGEFGGIGVEVIYDSGAIKIITPIDDLPAYNAGINAGDYIVGVNGQLVSNMGFNKAVKEMRGKPGTSLNLLVLKEDEQTTKEIELKREIVKIKPVKFEIEEDGDLGIGYIRIVAFNNKATEALKKAIEDIEQTLDKKKKKLSGIILDVRNNPGGVLDQAVAISEYFIDQGTIVSVKGKNSKDDEIISAGKFVQKAPKIPVVVLINSGSASAAEIVAAALQEHKRAVVVGTTSFGKGLVQKFIQLNDRAGMKLTTAKYYTPNGKSINATGVEPDIFIENAKVEYVKKEDDKKNPAFTSSSVKSYLKKYNNDEKSEENSSDKGKNEKKKEEKREMSKKYKEDYQYARAYDLIRGLIIGNKIDQ